MEPQGAAGSVAILLATFNGGKFLEDQLRSLDAQTVPLLDLWVSDDGSGDATLQILARWQQLWSKGRFVIVGKGPGTGDPADNFRALILATPNTYDAVAYCDQDDIWLPGKLEAAISRLHQLGDVPAVHCSRTQLIGDDGARLGQSRYFTRPPAFRNALVQSLAGGNTMVLNRAAFDLVQRSLARGPCVAHDWWTYQIVTGAGGQMLYRAEPDTLYRQHEANVVGSNMGWRAAFARIRMVMGGRFKAWNDRNLGTLELCRELLTAEANETLDLYLGARRGSLINRIRALRLSGVYRHTWRGNLSLWGACIAGLT